MKINVKLDNFDEELMFKRFSIRVGDKQIITPVKASHVQNPISTINEIYKKFDLTKINRCLTDEKFERVVNADVKKNMTQGINICLVEYNASDMPNNKQIEVLSDIQYEHSDIVTTPILSKITRELTEDKLLKSFNTITNRYIEIVETLNHKNILGVIPSRMPRQFLEPIIKNYKSKNITSFIIDF